MSAVPLPPLAPDATYSRSDIARIVGKSSDCVKRWERRHGLQRIPAPGHPRYRGCDVLDLFKRFAFKDTPLGKLPRQTPEQDLAELMAMR